MAQIINTNVASLNTQRNLNNSQSALAVSLQRLSSGLRINSARDDAAGLAISERFTAQIRGLNQAARNANDGVSLAQTAEGDLAQITNNLQRIRELAVQSANATNSSSDRAALQLEAAELIAEIDRVSSTSAFNSVNLLDGNFASQQFQVGANAGETVTITSIASARSSAIGQRLEGTLVGTAVTAAGLVTAGDLTINTVDVGIVAADAAAIATAISNTSSDVTATATNAQTAVAFADVVGSAADAALPTVATQTTIAGTDVGGGQQFIMNVDGIEAINVTFGAGNTVATVAIAAELDTDFAAFISANSGYTITSGAVSTNNLVLSKTDGTNLVIDLTGSTLSGVSAAAAGLVGTTNTGTVAVASTAQYGLTLDSNVLDFSTVGADDTITSAEVVGLINALAGYTAVDNAGTIDITKADGSNIVFTESGAQSLIGEGLALAATSITYRGTISVTSINADLVIGGTASPAAGFTPTTTTAVVAGVTVANTTVATVSGANSAIASIDAALTTINNSRASLGAIQNRFDSIVSSILTSVENLSAARSRIRDADFAEETATLTRNQILQQAGVSILAQANALPQLALSLLQ